MDYSQFKEIFVEKVTDAVKANGYDVKETVTKKNNGLELDALHVIYPNDSRVAPCIYINSFFEDYQRNNTTLDEQVSKFIGICESEKQSIIRIPTEFNNPDKLYAAVVNSKLNEDLLKDVPHKNIEDLAVVARYKVDSRHDMQASFLVRNAHCGSMFGMTSEEVIKRAISNNELNEKYELRSMGDVIREIMIQQGTPEEVVDSICPSLVDNQMFVLTNSSKMNGASVLCCKSELSKASEEIGQDFYILPSSIHELLLIPTSRVENPEDLHSMVQEVNATQVAQEDKLSDSVYIYRSKEMKIEQVCGLVRNEKQESILTNNKNKSR